MERKIILLASITGGLAVILGAFAAHGLKPILSDSAMDSLGTGIRYQMYHAFAVLHCFYKQFDEQTTVPFI